MNFLSKLARGEYSLPMTFWVYGTLYQILIGAIMIATIYFGVAVNSLDWIILKIKSKIIE